jgi:signal transduction histidine kinase
MGFRGVKSRVFIQFWILFFLSMLFIDILVMFFFLERIISHYTDQKRFSLSIACENQRDMLLADKQWQLLEGTIVFPESDSFFFSTINQFTSTGTSIKQSNSRLEAAVYQTLRSGEGMTKKVGQTAGWFFMKHRSVIITHPVKAEGETIAAGGIESSLNGIYQDFIRIQKIAFMFVVINSFFFALIGNRQLSRIYFKPLKRLARRAETYQDEDSLLFSVRKEDNEFSVLSSSLNKMLHRITEDKRVLRETIESLQTANRELTIAQNEVIRAEKLATVGRLTSGIAHEIGNPIGIVLGYLDLMKQTNLNPEERNDFIARSEKEITRINHIIRQLLDMSRSSAGQAKSISVHQLLQDLMVVFNYQPTASEIRFESRLDASEDTVFADPDRLRQVFLNVLLNAVDALHSKPTSQPQIRLVTACHLGEAGTRSIEIIVHDNGPGIQPSDLSRVFDPFFTTKQPGQGTGLGLSVSFMIIEKLGGHMSVSSSEEEGTAFQVILPLSKTQSKNGNDASIG